jgi:hypothetical protein
MDVPVQMSARATARLRCAMCHDALGDGPVECPGCHTRLHPDCALEARCPTLGCTRRGAPRAERHGGFARTALLAAGALLPPTCFLANEALRVDGGLARMVGRAMHPAYAPEVHRGLYPLLAWSIAALVAATRDRRAPWIEVGLRGGVALAGLFSLAYLPTLPAALIGILILIGLLGLAPYATLAAFVVADRRYRRAAPADEAKERAGVRDAWLLWLALAAGGALAAALGYAPPSPSW